MSLSDFLSSLGMFFASLPCPPLPLLLPFSCHSRLGPYLLLYFTYQGQLYAISAVLSSSLRFSVGWTGSRWGCRGWLSCLLVEEELWKLYSSCPTWSTTALVSMPVFFVLKRLPGRDGWQPTSVSWGASVVPVHGGSRAWATRCPAPSERCSEAVCPAPCFVCNSAKTYCETICCSATCCCSEKQKSLNWEDKCLFLVLHNQVLTFKPVTYVVDLSKCSLAFISKFSEVCKAGQTIQKFPDILQ